MITKTTTKIKDPEVELRSTEYTFTWGSMNLIIPSWQRTDDDNDDGDDDNNDITHNHNQESKIQNTEVLTE